MIPTVFSSLLRLTVLITVLSASVQVSMLHAHGAASGRIAKMTHAIEHHPKDASLWLKRGRYYLEKYHYDEAEADIKKALSLQPDLIAGHYFLAETWYYSEKYARALGEIDRFILALEERGDAPNHQAKAHGLKAGILMALHLPDEAALYYGHAALLTTAQNPEFYLLAAQAYVQADKPSSACEWVDKGVIAAGKLDVLLQQGFEASHEGHPERALGYLDAMIANGKRLPALYLQKAELLATLELPSEAGAALKQAQKHFSAWSDGKQQSIYGEEVKAGIEQLHNRLNDLLGNADQPTNA
ncbi:Uncharacterised protein [BD1-7 clade bacterium]|uniref:Lipopolysaccharide assembly protein B n=1 Tax=BD1-7 clade bacterium TaxID=2029982 RepID=A0A5S9PYH3_9GAMM|nr:Uncharacterised protein [BD1-7 clade bacterium]CAA0110145.1 Uncharacterised protein [BD1-7 clade bacterium]